MTTEQQIQLKQLEKECLELQIKLEELKKSNNGTFTYLITYPQNPNITPAFPNTPYYCGSGTTGVIAKELNRNFIGIELNPKYIEIAKERIENTKTQENLINL